MAPRDPNSPTRPRVSAIITTFNEEANIAGCIESLLWCDEILLVDSFSTDRTPEIAQRYDKVRFHQRTYFGSAAQKNWAMDQVETPWLLVVDADERVPEPLAREIAAAVGSAGARAFGIRRRNFFLGREIRHSGWSTDRVVRLLERDAARYPKRRVHADLTPEGPTPTLVEPLIHQTCRSLDQYLEKIQRYAVWGAADVFRSGRRAGAVELVFRPMWRFFRMYVVQAGFLDGRHGLVLCGLQAWSVFLKWARVWEWDRFRRLGWPVELPAYDESPEIWRESQ